MNMGTKCIAHKSVSADILKQMKLSSLTGVKQSALVAAMDE